MKKTKRTTAGLAAVVATAIVAASLIAGCSNSSGPSVPGYLEPSSPENVLANIDRAYHERNVDEFIGCLSEDFKFHLRAEDVQDPGLDVPPWFYRADEQQIHENIFSDDSNVVFTELDLTPTSVETIPGLDAGRPTGDVVVIRAATELRVGLQGGLVYLATVPQEFRFRIVSGRSAGDGRALWEMFEWRELDERGADAPDESRTWGIIKYLYLDELSQQARRTTPVEVIDQLETAYAAMDLDSYLDCLAEDFVFYPTDDDVQNPSNDIPPEWYKTDERNMHTNMFAEGSNVESISLALTNMDVDHEQGDPQDPLDDTYVHREGVDLRVNVYGGLTYLATAPSEFHLRVDQDEEGPYGEVMWEVYAWYDSPGGRAGEREQTSWGSIKAMYR